MHIIDINLGFLKGLAWHILKRKNDSDSHFKYSQIFLICHQQKVLYLKPDMYMSSKNQKIYKVYKQKK